MSLQAATVDLLKLKSRALVRMVKRYSPTRGWFLPRTMLSPCGNLGLPPPTSIAAIAILLGARSWPAINPGAKQRREKAATYRQKSHSRGSVTGRISVRTSQ